MNSPKVSIVIVNWNGRRFLEKCLASVFGQTYRDYDVILVDNGSSDGSAEYVETSFPLARVIRLDRNYGFAAANNAGIAEALKDREVRYVAALNNDTEVEPRWLEELVKAAEMHEEVGSLAPKILFDRPRNVICCTGICIYRDCDATERGRLEVDRGQYEEQEEVFGPTAASALFRRRMLEEVGLFDDDYFAYYEDVDLAWRARLAGWKCLYVPTAVVYHVLGGTSRQFAAFKAYYMERNRIWNLLKLLPLRMTVASVWYSGVRYAVLVYGVGVGKGAAGNFLKRESTLTMVTAVARAYLDAFLGLRSVLRKRRVIQATRVVGDSEIDAWFQRFGVGARELVLGKGA